MPNKGTSRAKQKRAGSLGQSSKFYKIKTSKGIVNIPGAQGFGKKITIDVVIVINKNLIIKTMIPNKVFFQYFFIYLYVMKL